MSCIHKLFNEVKHYEWGSLSMLPEFLGIENPEQKPHAELWMGTHSGAPSQTQVDGKLVNLNKVCGDLPFLFKLLAVDKPLSIQAHPDIKQAQEGFDRENKAALSIDDPKRNYKDDNHKPEIICALTPYTMMAGFRKSEDIKESLEALILACAHTKEVFSTLLSALQSGLKSFFACLFNLSKNDKDSLTSFIIGNESCDAVSAEQWKLMKRFASLYPGDPAIISPVYLNVLSLQPQQAVYIPAGVLHAYLSGFGVELMSSSDNVLRGGLTPKHVDINELLNILDFSPFTPQVMNPDEKQDVYFFPSPCDDFSLALVKCRGKIDFPVTNDALCIVTEGELTSGSKSFKKGDSFLIFALASPLPMSGNFTLFSASSNK